MANVALLRRKIMITVNLPRIFWRQKAANTNTYLRDLKWWICHNVLFINFILQCLPHFPFLIKVSVASSYSIIISLITFPCKLMWIFPTFFIHYCDVFSAFVEVLWHHLTYLNGSSTKAKPVVKWKIFLPMYFE